MDSIAVPSLEVEGDHLLVFWCGDAAAWECGRGWEHADRGDAAAKREAMRTTVGRVRRMAKIGGIGTMVLFNVILVLKRKTSRLI
jgi:hypothetical protein